MTLEPKLKLIEPFFFSSLYWSLISFLRVVWTRFECCKGDLKLKKQLKEPNLIKSIFRLKSLPPWPPYCQFVVQPRSGVFLLKCRREIGEVKYLNGHLKRICVYLCTLQSVPVKLKLSLVPNSHPLCHLVWLPNCSGISLLSISM